MASSIESGVRTVVRASAVCVALLGTGACSFGGGEGELNGSVGVIDCRPRPDYEMRPDFFAAEPIEELLVIRVQRGSGRQDVVDGIEVLVRNAALLQKRWLGVPLDVRDEDGPVQVTLYLNKSCPPARSRSPVVLPAVAGTVQFESIYAPEGHDPSVEIAADLSGLEFEDPRNPARHAELDGFFRFLFQRGRPAQRFP